MRGCLAGTKKRKEKKKRSVKDFYFSLMFNPISPGLFLILLAWGRGGTKCSHTVDNDVIEKYMNLF